MRERAMLIRAQSGNPRRGPRSRYRGPARAPGAGTGSQPPMTTPLKTRVLLADDHELVRSGLVLDLQPDIQVVEAADGAEDHPAEVHGRRHRSRRHRCLDAATRRPAGGGRTASASPAAAGADAQPMHDNEQYFFAALQAGASGYVLKSAASRDLVHAVRAKYARRAVPLSGGEVAVCPISRHGARGATPKDPLTAREVEILKLIAEAHTSDAIASMLAISRRTVEHHLANILRKLGMRIQDRHPIRDPPRPRRALSAAPSRSPGPGSRGPASRTPT